MSYVYLPSEMLLCSMKAQIPTRDLIAEALTTTKRRLLCPTNSSLGAYECSQPPSSTQWQFGR